MALSENQKVILTADGSHSVTDSRTGETYHSVHGAITESVHVFLRNGFQACSKKEIFLLEVGFGTGLNALLTLLEAVRTGQKVCYVALEPFPLPLEKVQLLNYPALLPDCPSATFRLLHEAPWEKEVRIAPHFYLTRHRTQLELSETNLRFDLVYFDAFSPAVQPTLWQKEIFDRLFSIMAPGSLLVTYAAKGQVRRNMQEAGFRTERLPGAPGKREMLRARKI
ncbi:MAG: tRNA (5-methylaminomethyl-2-thiouridine)(34)-methyltransferase MnmD [Bacteroidales bacterium]|nr:tRNA (5-methylaminomethyl-2-thiouridine)(34)-methyltransferase MnmD [Bacteroidales bacterium]